MDTQRFSQGTRFFWQDWEYEVKQILSKKKVTIENQASAEMQAVALSTLLRAFHRAEIIIWHDDVTAKTVTSKKALEHVVIDCTPIEAMVINQNDHSGDKLMPMYHVDRATGYIVGFFIESGEV